MKCKKLFALLLSLCMIASTFVALPVSAATENVIDIDLPLDDASELTWVQSGVTVSNADGIGGRDNVVSASGLSNSNSNTVGVKLPDGFSFAAGDVLTYSVDVYSETAINPDMWLRNHASGLSPFATLYEPEMAASTWTTITKTFTYEELEAKIATSGSSGTFATTGNYAFYMRPRQSAVVYLDNFKLSVARPVVERHNVIDITVNDASDITWKNGGTAADANGIGGRDGVIELGNLANGNTNTAGIVLADSFAFKEGDILTYSLDVYSDTVTHPDLWLRNHGSSLNPFTTFYHTATTGTWTTITKTVTYADLTAAAAGWDAADKYALYVRPRETGTVYIDNFTVTVSRVGAEEHIHSYGGWETDGDENHKKECECGDVVTEAHTWDDGVVESDVITYTCAACGATKTEAYEARIDVVDIDSATTGLTMVGANVTLTADQTIGDRSGVVKADGVSNTNDGIVGVKLPDGFAFRADDKLTYSVDVYSETEGYKPDIYVRDHSDFNPMAVFYGQATAANAWTTITKTVTYDELVAASLAVNSNDTFNEAGNFAVYIRPRDTSAVYLDNFTVTVSRKLTGEPTLEAAVGYVTLEDGVFTATTADIATTEASGAWSSQVRLRIIPEQPVSINDPLKISFDFESVGILNSIGQPYQTMVVNLRLYDSVDGSSQANTIGYIKNEAAVANFGAPVTLEYYIEDMVNGGGASTLTDVKSIGVQVDMNGACLQYNTEANDGYFTISNVKVESEEKPEHVHSYSDWVKVDEENHKKACGCGDIVTEAHTWDDGVVESDVITYTCAACGATKTEAYEARIDVVDIDSATTDYTMVGANVTLTADQTIGDRSGVVKADGVSNTNDGIVGFKLPDGFAFKADDILTYSVDVYSESAVKPDIYVRNHGTSYNPMAPFYNTAITAGAWTTITKTVTFAELEAAISENSSGTFATADNYAVYLRPRDASVVYLDNFTVTVSRVGYEEPPHEHAYEGVVTKEATHTEEGVKTFTCECGDSYTEEIPANVDDHDYGEGVVTLEPTCADTGVKTFTCACGDSYTEEIPATDEHTPGEWVKHDEIGHKQLCTVCDIILYTAMHEWDAGVVTTEPTVDAEGVKTYTCTVCGEEKTEAIDKLPADDKVTVTAGKVKASAGSEVVVPVSIANNDIGLTGLTVRFEYDANVLTYIKAEKGEALPDMDLSKPGTAYTEGDLTFNWDNVDADATNGEILLITFKVADDAADGNYPINVTVKNACDFDLNDVESRSVSGEVSIHTHQMTFVAEIPAECEAEGTKAHYICAPCGKKFEDEAGTVELTDLVIPATGHAYDTGVITQEPTCEDEGVKTFTCANCGDTYTETVAATGHSYDAGVVTQEPTCTEDGVKTFTCICGDTYTEAVAATGHSMTFVAEIPAECEVEGTKVHYACANCGKTFEDEAGNVELTDLVIPATGHAYDAGVITQEPTCEDEGVKTFTCANCGDTYTETVAALGHSYDAGVVTQEPTCTEDGVKTFTCANCGGTYTEVVAATGHSMTFVAEIPAECEAEGTKAHYVCANCGKTYEDEAGTVELTDLVIPALGHSYGEWQKNDADTHKKVCACGDEVTEAHAWDAGVVTTKPTVDAEGVKTYTCTVCSEEKTEAIEKLDPATLTAVTVGSGSATAGNEVTIPVSISKNAGLTGLILDVEVNTNVLTLTKAEKGAGLEGLDLTIPADLTVMPATFVWDGMNVDNTNGDIVLLTFKVADTAAAGSYAIAATVRSAYDQNLDDVAVVVTEGDVSVAEYMLGDVNGDGEVEVKDLVLIRRYLTGGYGVTINENAADVNHDGKVEVKDLVLIRRYIAGGYGIELK